METILITGGSRGIGAATVKKCIGQYNIAFFYLNSKDKAEQLVHDLSPLGAIAAFECDVANEQSVKNAVLQVKERFGKIDLLVNAAGISKTKLFVDLSADDWHDAFATNVDGTFFVTREVIGDMLSRKNGSIVNVASIWGEEGASVEVAYSASKAAIIGMTKALAKEVAPNGVRVNAVAPGAIDTDMMKEYSADDIEDVCDSIPLGRLGTADEVAEAICYLAKAKYVTGAMLDVNGGGIF